MTTQALSARCSAPVLEALWWPGLHPHALKQRLTPSVLSRA